MKSFIIFLGAVLLSRASGAEIGIYQVESRPMPGLREMTLIGKADTETLYVASRPVIGTADFVAVDTKDGKLNLRLSEAAQIRFTELTKERSSEGRMGRIAIILDGVVMIAPTIRAEFTTQWIHVGAVSPQQLDALNATIRANSRKG